MIEDALTSNLEIAELHAQRLKLALSLLKPLIPITGEHIASLSNEELLAIELFTSRFAKLQDTMGAKLFGLVLEWAEEIGPFDSLLDKLHRLEKLGCIPDAHQWIEMRHMRNILSHEYPDNPKITADYLNLAYQIAPFLIGCLDRIKQFIEDTKKKK